MSYTDIFRSDPGSGQAHHGISRPIGGTTRSALAHGLLHDAADFGAGATGNVLNAATADALGSFIDCDGKTQVVFKLEFSALGTRQFRVMFKDTNATPLYWLGGTYTASAVGVADGVGAAATRVSTYFHADGLLVPCFGFKTVTLWLLDGLSAPTVHAWGVAV